MYLNDILAKLKDVKKLSSGEYIAKCPAHEDKHPSLTLREAEDKLLLDCKAGCKPESVVEALGLTMVDLFIKTEPKIIATYDYEDEDENFLFQVVRYEPKAFKQRTKDSSGNWIWNLENVRRVLWKLPEILIWPDTIYFVEGEKDALKLWEYGQVATTSPGGAANWKPEYANHLAGKRVVLIPDKDEAGFAYARKVIKSLQGKARELKCIILPGEDVKDFSDWIISNDIAELPLLEEDIAILLHPQLPSYSTEEEHITWGKKIEGDYLSFQAEEIRHERTGTHAKVSIFLDYRMLAWSLLNIERSEDRTRLSNLAHAAIPETKDYTKENLRRDLDIFCSGLWDYYTSGFSPQFIEGQETIEPPNFYLHPYIIEDGGTILFAPPGRGKSLTALLWAQSINAGITKLWQTQKAAVLYVNLERSAQSLKARLASVNKILGLPSNYQLLILNARGKSLQDIAPAIRKATQQFGIKLMIIDSLSRAGFGDLTENRPVNAIIDTISGLCPTWLALGHTPRASEEHVYGSIFFDAGADIVIQLRTQINTNGTMGLGYEITKANDLPHYNQQILAFEFGDYQLKEVRTAQPYEFPDIEVKKKGNMLDDIIDFILNQDTGDASATDLEKALGFHRVNISKLLNNSGRFVKTHKLGTTQYFGVKEYV